MTHSLRDTANLKIAAIDIYPFDIRMREPFRIATMTAHSSPNVLVHIRTNDDLSGWGEASPLHSIAGETQAICLAAAREIAPILIGQNPLEIASLVAQMNAFLPHNTTIKGAFDMALYDIAAQAAGLPLYRFLGGRLRPMESDLTIAICEPQMAGRKARAITAEKGFRIIKVKLGATFEEDDARLRAIREAVGPDITLRVDANQAWDRTTAIRSLKAFTAYNIEFCEQPLCAYDVAGLRLVSEAVSIPLMADEALFSPAEALRLVTEEAAPYFNIKLSKSGGIHNALKIAAIAEASGRKCMVGCMLESRLGLAASAHFACASETVCFYDLDSCYDHAEEPIEGGIQYKDGLIQLPETPGIGAAPTPETLGHMRKANAV
ncbi:MAG TPA: dipeptide epimerase [Chthonomonadaceae bacterium]|nr:dipeptide epimerase [Chthonomonadaceae bacterium]